MAQWYPKLAEYDQEGWHPTPYIAREFYGVWGDFEVNITIDKKYILGGSGYLQNKNEIGKITCEKTLGMGGKKMEIPDKLPVANFSVGFASGGWQRRALISLVD